MTVPVGGRGHRKTLYSLVFQSLGGHGVIIVVVLAAWIAWFLAAPADWPGPHLAGRYSATLGSTNGVSPSGLPGAGVPEARPPDGETAAETANRLGGSARRVATPTDTAAERQAMAAEGRTVATGQRSEATGAESRPGEEDPAAESEPSDATLSIAGSVLDDRGTLLPGIAVSLAGVGDAETGPAGSQATDANGMFAFRSVREGEYVLSASPGQSYRPASIRVRAGVASAELRLQRIRSVQVLGLVSDPRGTPLDQVRVRVLGAPETVLSDADGVYEIEVDLLKAGQPPVLEFSRADFREQRQRVNAAVGSDAEATRLDVVMEPQDLKVALSGRVVGPGEEPVPGARVWLSSPDPRSYRATIAGRFGDYRFEQVEAGEDYRAGVEATEGYQALVSEAFAVGPDDTVRDLSLLKSGEGVLSGTLVDPQGEVLSGFSMWLRDMGSSGGSPMPVRADGSGRFLVEAVPAGPVEIQTRSEPVLEASGITLSPGETRDVVVPLDWGPHWLFGQVVDGTGSPVGQARVVLQWRQQYADVYSTSRREVISDRLGYFTFANLGAGDHVLTVLAPGFQVARTVQATGRDGDQLQITLQPIGTPGQGDGS